MNITNTVASITGNWRRRITALAAHPVLVLTLLTMLGAVLRIYKLDAYDFWHDEVITVFASRPTPSTTYAWTGAYSVHPPLYYMALHLWSRLFGAELVALRMFSVLQSILCIPLVFLLGRDLAGWRVGLVAATLTALAPFQIFHGQQARMYPLLTMLVLVATWSFFRAWRSADWRWWALLGLTAAVGFYSHVYFAFSLLGLNLWACFETWRTRHIDRRRWAGLLISQSLAVLAFMPFVSKMLGLTQTVISSYWIAENTPFDWMFALISLSNYATFGLERMAAWYVVLTYFPAVAAVLLTLIYSSREARRQVAERPAWGLLLFSLWTPIVVATLLSLTVQSILIDRSLIGLSGALFVLLAWMAVRYWQRSMVQALAAIYIVSCLATLILIYPANHQPNDFRLLTDYLAANAQPDDAIAYADWQSFDHAALFHPEQANVCVVPSQTLDQAFWLRRMAFMQWREPYCSAPLADFASDYQRVWLVLTSYTFDAEEHLANSRGWIEQHGRLLDTQRFGNAVVWLYAVDTP